MEVWLLWLDISSKFDDHVCMVQMNPEQDVCKIWSTDHAKKKILGGFAIRSVDEKYTVPLVTKNRIAGSFCSPNSGMQGSRAIEKMRGPGRIDRNTAIEQAVSFDMHLFQNIMNDIDDCSEDAALKYLVFLLRLRIERRDERDEKLLKLADKTDFAVLRADDLIDFCNECGDPQLVKLLVAVLLVPL